MFRALAIVLVLLQMVSCKSPVQRAAAVKDEDMCAQYADKDCSCNLQCTACQSNAASAEQFSCVKNIALDQVPGLKKAAGYVQAGAQAVDKFNALAEGELGQLIRYFLAYDDNGDLTGADDPDTGGDPAEAGGAVAGDGAPASPEGRSSGGVDGLPLAGDDGLETPPATSPDPVDPLNKIVDDTIDKAQKKIEARVDKEIDKLETKLRKKGDQLVDSAGNLVLGAIGVNGCTKQGRLAFKAAAKAFDKIAAADGSLFDQGTTVVDAVQKLAPSLDAALGCVSPKARAFVEKKTGDIRDKITRTVIQPVISKIGASAIDVGQLGTAVECTKSILKGATVLAENVGCLFNDLAELRASNKAVRDLANKPLPQRQTEQDSAEDCNARRSSNVSRTGQSCALKTDRDCRECCIANARNFVTPIVGCPALTPTENANLFTNGRDSCTERRINGR